MSEQLSKFDTLSLIDELRNRGLDVIDPELNQSKSPLNQFSTEEIIEYLSEDFAVFSRTYTGAIDALEFAEEMIEYPSILDHMDEREIEDYATCEVPHYPDSGSGGNFYKNECIDLLNRLISDNGFDFVYNLINQRNSSTT